jgi:transcriptional regulator with XRE-family HTH domain
MARRIDVGTEIKAIRRERGLTQEDVADALETTQAAISRLESGIYRPRWDLVMSVLGVLSVNAEEWARLRP